MKKNTTGLWLLVCLVLPYLITFSCLHYQKRQVRKAVKKQMMAELDDSELVLLQFTLSKSISEIKWEHEGEFEYQGVMYDLVKSEMSGDTVLYWCWPDHKETRLNQELGLLVARVLGENPENKKNQRRFQDFFKSLFHVKASLSEISLCYSKPHTGFYAHHYFFLSLSPPSPPPELS
ncbi:MAG: hypothetical protein KDD63_09535 [Bacteroidetes bacterium]|nr:hypothetical protein [Bacteroidota bacterium]MCB0852453.1 hypothetical protein [Bacteroidota bacterium]